MELSSILRMVSRRNGNWSVKWRRLRPCLSRRALSTSSSQPRYGRVTPVPSVRASLGTSSNGSTHDCWRCARFLVVRTVVFSDGKGNAVRCPVPLPRRTAFSVGQAERHGRILDVAEVKGDPAAPVFCYHCGAYLHPPFLSRCSLHAPAIASFVRRFGCDAFTAGVPNRQNPRWCSIVVGVLPVPTTRVVALVVFLGCCSRVRLSRVCSRRIRVPWFCSPLRRIDCGRGRGCCGGFGLGSLGLDTVRSGHGLLVARGGTYWHGCQR